MAKRRIVPQTVDELESLCKEVMDESGLNEPLLVKGIVCSGLINMPRDEDHVNLAYLVALARKEVCRDLCAKQRAIVNNEIEKYNSEMLVKNYVVLFKEDPNNFEVRDALQKLADKGYSAAKEGLGDAYIHPPVEELGNADPATSVQ
jgi:hypothetical protein